MRAKLYIYGINAEGKIIQIPTIDLTYEEVSFISKASEEQRLNLYFQALDNYLSTIYGTSEIEKEIYKVWSKVIEEDKKRILSLKDLTFSFMFS